jgi:hypothetical protein
MLTNVVVAISDDNSDWHDPRNHVFVWAVIPVDWSALIPSVFTDVFQGQSNISGKGEPIK